MVAGRLLLAAALCLGGAQLGRATAPDPARPTSVTTSAATLAWMHAVATFVSADPDPAVIERDVLAAGRLDPTWRTPWRQGALMLGVLGDVDAHERVLRAAVSARPEDPWFPYALGMSRHLNRGDREGAARWLRWASTLPDAPPVLERAAERIGSRP